MALTGLTLSMIVNALVTGLIVFRIFKVFRALKTSAADDRILGVTGGSTLQRVIFIIIESGVALFSIQLARLVATAPDIPEAIPENGIVDEERRHDNLEIQFSDHPDIQMAER